MMRYAVRHVTVLRYASPVRFAQFNVRLRPALWPGQRLHGYQLELDPQPARIENHDGGYYVHEARFSVREPIRQLRIESRFEVERDVASQRAFQMPGPGLRNLREQAMRLPDLSALAPASYIFASPMAPPESDIAVWGGAVLQEDMPVMAAGQALMTAIHREFRYLPGVTFADTPVLDAFERRAGVCQDFSHVMIVAARAWGIPAAYVSGYLRTEPPAGQPRLVGADAMHAWVALWCGQDLGWIGFDPTNNVLAGEDHIFVGMGRDFSDVSPLDGTFKGTSQQTMHVSVDVAPLG